MKNSEDFKKTNNFAVKYKSKKYMELLVNLVMKALTMLNLMRSFDVAFCRCDCKVILKGVLSFKRVMTSVWFYIDFIFRIIWFSLVNTSMQVHWKTNQSRHKLVYFLLVKIQELIFSSLYCYGHLRCLYLKKLEMFLDKMV